MGATPATVGSAAETLALWERAGSLDPVGRALVLAAYDGADPAALATEPIGRCHARILRWRTATLGHELTAVAACPACATRVEFALDPGELLATQAQATARDDDAPDPPPPVLAWRLPTLHDLAALDAEPEPAAALLRACVTVGDDVGDPTGLPAETLEAVEEAMMAADPLAELSLTLRCPDCDTSFVSSLDLAGFVWTELDARAARILQEVDVLARAYGWSEPQVLALSEQRRAAYLELALEHGP